MIIERIKRKIEPEMYILPQSTPVIYFGNYDTARACTISLNPSNKEFVDNSDILLDNKNRERLCSRKKLEKSDNDELTDDEAKKVLKYCTDYFSINPLKAWFDPFNYFIERYGNYSYYKGTCVHLDLVQWATYKKWSDISEDIKQKHLINDLPILKYLLNKDFEIMFLNGTTVVNNVSKCLNISLREKSTMFKNTNNISKSMIIYHGKYNKTDIIGWSPYLHSATVGGYENKSILCDLIKKNIPIQ